MVWDLDTEENLFSSTFHTSTAEAHPIVSASTDGDKVELIKVSEAFSFDFQIKKSGFTIVVYDPDRYLRNFLGISWCSSSNSYKL